MKNNIRKWKQLIEDCGEINSTASEHDHEASMARGQLYHVAKDAIKLIKMIEKGDNLEGWVASKITKAKENISVVADYMESEMTINNNDSPEEYTKVPEDGSSHTSMNKYGLSARNHKGKFYSYKDGKMTGSFDSMEELAKHQEAILQQIDQKHNQD
tara:strand:- start:1075 stop:1545 length:471 start_codon:yes stop_codon:yes gene_type:complete